MASQLNQQSNSQHNQQFSGDQPIAYKYSVGFSNISPSVNIQEVFQQIQMEHIYINYIKPSIQDQRKYLSYSFLAHFSSEQDLEIFINSYLPFKIPKSEFTAIKKETIKKEDLPKDNRIILSNVDMNDINQIWEELSKYGRVLLMKIDYFQDEDSIKNSIQVVFQTKESALQAIAALDNKNVWGQKLRVELSPIPTPLKDQKVLFVRGLDSNINDQEIIQFLKKVFDKSNTGIECSAIEVSRKYNLPQGVVFFPDQTPLDIIVEKIDEKQFEGNYQKLKVQKFLSKQERIKAQIDKEKQKPLNTLYLQGLKPEVTTDQITQEIQSVFPDRKVKVSVSLKTATYPQIKSNSDQSGPVTGQTAIVEMESEQDAEFTFLNIRKSINFQQLFFPLFLKQNSFIQQFVNKVLRTQFLNIRKEFFEKRQNQMRRFEDQKRKKKQINILESLPKPDFIDNMNPIFNPLDFNQQNLESELNQSTRTGTGNFNQSQDDFSMDLSVYEKNQNDPYVKQFSYKNYNEQKEEILLIGDHLVKGSIYYKMLKDRFIDILGYFPKQAFELIAMILSELKSNVEGDEKTQELEVFSEIFNQSNEEFKAYFVPDSCENKEE